MSSKSDSTIQSLGLGVISPGLCGSVALSPRALLEIDSAGTLSHTTPLKQFVLDHHAELLRDIVCIDLTIYEYARQGLPFFHLIVRSDTMEDYIKVIEKLVTPTYATTDKGLTHSVAVHREFIENDSFITIQLSPLDQTSAESICPEEAFEKHYPLRKFSPSTHETPDNLNESLIRFQQLLQENQKSLVTFSGEPIGGMVCCNFRIIDENPNVPPRPLAQLFVGVSSGKIRPDGQVTEDLRLFINNLSALIYRGNSAGILLREGIDTGRDIFTHEAKKLLQMIRRWPTNLEAYFQPEVGGGVSLKPDFRDRFRIEDFKVVPLPHLFDTAAAQAILWTMANSAWDLPFGQNGPVGYQLPSTFKELSEECLRVAKSQTILMLIRALGALHSKTADLSMLQCYLDSKLPHLVFKSKESLPRLDWLQDLQCPNLVNLSRMLIVACREAIYHGAWSYGVGVECSLSESGSNQLKIAISNRRWDSRSEFDDLDETVTGYKADQIYVHRKRLHKLEDAPLGPDLNRRQGRNELFDLAIAAGGEITHISNPNEENPDWIVLAQFNLGNEN